MRLLKILMNDLEKACLIAVKEWGKGFDANSPRTKIVQIKETDELYMFSFYAPQVIYGGGGLIVYKKDFSVIDYCIPSYPLNIFEILDAAVEVEIPEKYR